MSHLHLIITARDHRFLQQIFENSMSQFPNLHGSLWQMFLILRRSIHKVNDKRFTHHSVKLCYMTGQSHVNCSFQTLIHVCNSEFIQSCNITLNDKKLMNKSVTLIITNNANKNRSLMASPFISQTANAINN